MDFLTGSLLLLLAVGPRDLPQSPQRGDPDSPVTGPRPNHFTKLFRHAQWPPDSLIRAGRIDRRLVQPDIDELCRELDVVLRPRYRPTPRMRQDVVPCLALREGSDYLLLRYSPNDSLQIEVQQGRTLYLTIRSRRQSGATTSDLDGHAREIAFRMLNYPGVRSGTASPLEVLVADVQPPWGRCGTISYGEESSPPEYWYSSIDWWSNGVTVLFEISRRHTVEPFSRWASLLPGQLSPRRFHYRYQDSK